MKLLASLTSPFARKVRVVLAEKHIECKLEVVNPWEEVNPVTEHNPLGQVPTLVLPDGSAIFDSRVIVDYLDSISPAGKLIPEPGRQRVQVRRWEALADGITEAAMRIFLERKRPAEKQDADWMALQRRAIDRGLDTLELELDDRPWYHGHGLSLADIAVGCSLGYLDFRLPEIEWRRGHANLAQLADKLSQHASFKDTMPVA